MGEFFRDTKLGQILKHKSTKLHQEYLGAKIYRVDVKINKYLQKGYYYYLDTLHYDHIEVANGREFIKHVLNLDGTLNEGKTFMALREKRRIWL